MNQETLNKTNNKNNNKIIIKKHIDNIKSGDLIIERRTNKEMTVSKKDIRFNSFFGFSVFGDSYDSGFALVECIKFIVPTKLGVVLR